MQVYKLHFYMRVKMILNAFTHFATQGSFKTLHFFRHTLPPENFHTPSASERDHIIAQGVSVVANASQQDGECVY